MSIAETVGGIIAFVMAVIFAFMSVLHFMEKGYLFNNAYIWASKEEREKMYKKPYYRQSAIVYCVISINFFLTVLSIVFKNDYIMLLIIPLIIGAVIYAIVSSAIIERRKKK